MQVKYSVQIWKLIGRAVILMLTISLIILIAFLGLAWLSGSLQIPVFRLSSQAENVPTRLIVDVQPTNATITLNGQQFKNGDSPIPGEYTVKVTHDGFYSLQETFRVHPDQENYFNIHLVPMIIIDEIARYATAPGWDTEGNLYFLDGSDGKIHKWANDTSTAMVSTMDGTYQLTYTPAGTHAFALAVTGPESESHLNMIDLQKGSVADLGPATAFSLGLNGKIIWGFNYSSDINIKPFWSLEPGGSPKLLSLDNLQWATHVDQLLVDSNGQWLAIEGPKGIAVWEIATGKMVATFENATAPVWVQNPKLGLAFLNADHSLNFVQEDSNWNPTKLLSNIQTPLASMPGGSEIIFTRYNPFEGGTSFWAVDTATLGVRLLSEAKTESGRVEQFAMSLDRKKIAFVNQKNILYLVTLEP